MSEHTKQPTNKKGEKKNRQGAVGAVEIATTAVLSSAKHKVVFCLPLPCSTTAGVPPMIFPICFQKIGGNLAVQKLFAVLTDALKVGGP